MGLVIFADGDKYQVGEAVFDSLKVENTFTTQSNTVTEGTQTIDVTDPLALDVRADNDGQTALSVDTSNTQVGVGTETPQSELDVYSSGENMVIAQSSDNNAKIGYTAAFDNSGTAAPLAEFYSITAGDTYIAYNLIGGGKDLIFESGTGPSSVAVLTDNGQLGLQTTSPNAQLDVRGSAIINEGGGDNDFRVEGQNQDNLLRTDAGNDRVGVNTSSPDHIVDIHDTNDNSIAEFREADTTVFYNGIDAGPIQAAEDTYQQLIDQDVTNNLSAGDQVGYTFAVDNSTVAEVSAEADGSGGIQRAKFDLQDVAKLTVRSSTPSNPVNGDVYLDDGTNTSSGNYALRVYNGTSWVDQN